jgi:hypothetical protein
LLSNLLERNWGSLSRLVSLRDPDGLEPVVRRGIVSTEAEEGSVSFIAFSSINGAFSAELSAYPLHQIVVGVAEGNTVGCLRQVSVGKEKARKVEVLFEIEVIWGYV